MRGCWVARSLGTGSSWAPDLLLCLKESTFVILYHLTTLSRMREKNWPPGRRGSFQSTKRAGGSLSGLLLGCFRVKCFFSSTSVISIFAVTFHFLISLLFPGNCSYLSLQSLPIVPPILISILLQGEGWGEIGGARDGAVWLWRELMRGLIWGIPFLNHNSNTGYSSSAT